MQLLAGLHLPVTSRICEVPPLWFVYNQLSYPPQAQGSSPVPSLLLIFAFNKNKTLTTLRSTYHTIKAPHRYAVQEGDARIYHIAV